MKTGHAICVTSFHKTKNYIYNQAFYSVLIIYHTIYCEYDTVIVIFPDLRIESIDAALHPEIIGGEE